MNELVNIERWGYHLKHCAIAFGLYLICVNLGIPKFYSAIISGTVLLFIKKFIFEKPSDWQGWVKYLKDLFTDWIEFQVVWLIYFNGTIWFWIVLVAILIFYYIFVVKLNWAFP